MADTAQYIGDLNIASPADSESRKVLGASDRQIKKAAKQSFPYVTGPVTATHTELNYTDGVTSNIQTQLDAKAPIASPTFTGTPAAPTATSGDNSTQLATTAFVAAAVATATGGTGLLTLSVSNSASVTLVKGQHDAATYAGTVTWTLPASPAAGDTVAVTVANDRIDSVIARNGNKIMSLSENMTVDNKNVTVTLRYINSTVGWRLV